jgi:hypothetical protein
MNTDLSIHIVQAVDAHGDYAKAVAKDRFCLRWGRTLKHKNINTKDQSDQGKALPV